MGKRLFASPFPLSAKHSPFPIYPLANFNSSPLLDSSSFAPLNYLIDYLEVAHLPRTFKCIFIKYIKQITCLYYKFYLTLQRLTMRRVMSLTDGSN